MSEGKLSMINNVLQIAQLTQPKHVDLHFFWDILYKLLNSDLTFITVPHTCLD
jgi:hypothetical protein